MTLLFITSFLLVRVRFARVYLVSFMISKTLWKDIYSLESMSASEPFAMRRRVIACYCIVMQVNRAVQPCVSL